MFWNKKSKKRVKDAGDYIDEWAKSAKLQPCRHPEHNFPTTLLIPPGESYTHTCPGCGKTQTCSSPEVTL